MGHSLGAISSEASPVPAVPARLDPADRGVWDDGVVTPSGKESLAHAGLIALIPSLVLGVLMLGITYVVSRHYDLPFRDADGILGSRISLLLGTIAFFMALDVVPRAIRRRGWRLSELRVGVPELIRERWSWRRLAIVLLGIVAFYMTYLAYRNLKSFLPLITDQDLDQLLLDFEQNVLGGTHPFDVLHTVLGTGIAAQVLSTVYLFFLAFVPISLGASLIVSINPLPGLWWVLTLGINWTLGTLSYYLVPTMGPWFIAPQLFADLPATGVSRLQESLLTERLEVIADPRVTEAVQSVAGFASLHASITVSALLIAHLLRLAKPIRIALWIYVVLTMLATVYFGWHYVLDDIAGILIGFISVYAGALLTGNRDVLRRRPSGDPAGVRVDVHRAPPSEPA